ncbi:TPA: hypothetical protein NJ360_003483 [Vibrio parahaemolyticus]|uniref:hypothetical protein n=1 Tax=Vibrio parahaemolyticus TaxID=670 RepID=UPI000A3674C9|nr:hypothetical protein [Vibrio parahaemolyticus]EHZ2643456.1 hypothetical protein [Vibrio parahaemolyticus]EIO4560856.1 hypothetical protein [Vibrio parahaemolyticus]EIO4611655.1 hypothetical protein [Vibrio parahaemolyticus]ELA7845863.1 hypothetical protein [Vibrio parahaemolyticus]ELM4065386.1 hypothetical protein [Vibrio parahaemolyticus]
MDVLRTRPSIKEQQLRSRIEQTVNLKQFFKVIDSRPETSGAGVIYIAGDSTIISLRKFNSSCRVNPISIILKEPTSPMSADSYAKELKSSNRESKLASELIGAGLSCASAALGWMVVVGSVGAIPISGGTSAAVTYLGYSAAAASTVQCMVGIGRSGAEGFAPDKLDELDSQAWYQNTSKALDYISLVGVGASGTATIKAISNLQKSSGKSLSEVLKGLNRHERARLTKEISKQNIPNLSSKAYKQLVRSGSVKRRFSSQDISNAIQLQLKDAIGATISFVGSATSGNVGAIAVGVYEEFSIE